MWDVDYTNITLFAGCSAVFPLSALLLARQGVVSPVDDFRFSAMVAACWATHCHLHSVVPCSSTREPDQFSDVDVKQVATLQQCSVHGCVSRVVARLGTDRHSLFIASMLLHSARWAGRLPLRRHQHGISPDGLMPGLAVAVAIGCWVLLTAHSSWPAVLAIWWT